MGYEDMLEMRNNGATYQEIADTVGCSKQYVHQCLAKSKPEIKFMRGKGFCIKRIVYKGIYDHFVRNPEESVTSFAKKVFGHGNANGIDVIRKFITGVHDSYFNLTHIKRMCEVTGLTFEELFERRDTD